MMHAKIIDCYLYFMCLQSVSEVDDLDQVKYISLPSSSVQMIDDLSILSSSKLCVVNLPYNYISDLNPFHSCVNLIKLDVSGNQVNRESIALPISQCDIHVCRQYH